MSQPYYNQFGGYKQQPYQSYGYPQQPFYGSPGATPSMPASQMPTGAYPPGGVGVTPPSAGSQVPGMLPVEQSYIENILRLNKGKLVEVYTTFENNSQWNAKIFKGIIEAAGRDHLILSQLETGKRALIPMVYVDYVLFDEEIEYEYPYGAMPGVTSTPPR